MRSAWLLCVGIASFGACATASESEDPGTSDASTRAETSTTRDTGTTTDSSSTGDTGSTDSSTTTDASTSDAKTDGGADAKTDTSVAAACDAPSDCMGARDLGSLDGDDGNGVISTAGTSSEWIKVRLSEKKRGLLYALDRTPVKFKVTLTSTGNTNYDLFVYYDKTADNVECVTETMSSETTTVDEVADKWGDNTGSDDSRTVNIEVRRKSGNCGSSGGWTLDVSGNVN